jgi:hypothetical protein
MRHKRPFSEEQVPDGARGSGMSVMGSPDALTSALKVICLHT